MQARVSWTLGGITQPGEPVWAAWSVTICLIRRWQDLSCQRDLAEAPEAGPEPPPPNPLTLGPLVS